MKEVVLHAAMRAKNGMIFLGKSHADCFHQAKHVSVEHSQAAEDQGFFSSKGRYLTRIDAYKVAVFAGQIKDEGPGKVLFSEMIWCAQDGGQYQYNAVTGYTK